MVGKTLATYFLFLIIVMKDIKELQGSDLINYFWSQEYWTEYLLSKGCLNTNDPARFIYAIKLEDLGDGKCKVSWRIDRGEAFDEFLTESFSDTYENLTNINKLGASWKMKHLKEELDRLEEEKKRIQVEISKLIV